MRYFKVGGLRFLRVGRLQLSFCIVRRKPVTMHTTRTEPTLNSTLAQG
jgi:hypothetical protein